MRRARWVLAVAGLLLLGSAIMGVAEPRFGRAADTAQATTITVVATGTATTVPDRAAFHFGVDSRAKTAKEALAKNAAAAADLIAALKASGVVASDIQTDGVWLAPQTAPGGDITGYIASNGVSAKTAIAQAGSLVDSAVAAGATNVSGPSLLVSDEATLEKEALKDAVGKAAGRAAALAAGAGLTLGAVRSISEAQPPPVYPGASGVAAPSAGGTPTTPVEPGMQTAQATITVTYAAG